MTDIGKKMNNKEAIANWEDEGGALRPIQQVKKNDHVIFIWIGLLVSLPFFFWLAKRR